jgi:hypothetical protein
MARMRTLGVDSFWTLRARRARFGAGILLGALLAIETSAPVHGGAVVLSRQTTLQATGAGAFSLADGTNNFGTYTVNLTISPESNPAMSGGKSWRSGTAQGVGEPLGSGAAAVPIPPAVWTGLMMLGGLGVMMFRSGRGGMSSWPSSPGHFLADRALSQTGPNVCKRNVGERGSHIKCLVPPPPRLTRTDVSRVRKSAGGRHGLTPAQSSRTECHRGTTPGLPRCRDRFLQKA